ncbi:MAG TPA: CoA pyrophosphatase, partial [Gammaproteobacteria bacterium]|nr:CoA pyrophosphatase [Gammaproteobacteria bacterium]
MADWLSRIRTQAPRHLPAADVLNNAHAAVLIAITDHREPDVILTRRADHLTS